MTIHRNNGSGNLTQPVIGPELTGLSPRRSRPPTSTATATRTSRSQTWFDDEVTILRNGGGGNFTEPGSSPETVGDGPQSVAAADFDGDGDQDLAIANQNSSNVTILRNNGAANFVEPASSPEPAGGGASSVAAADLDGDGDRDLAVANLSSDNATILRNNGNGNFAALASSPEAAGDAPFSIVADDLDGDGDRDLAVANLVSDDVTILRNLGAANFTEPASSPETVGDGPFSIAAADFDADADLDLAVANSAAGTLTILRNNLAANFNEVGTSPETTGATPTRSSPQRSTATRTRTSRSRTSAPTTSRSSPTSDRRKLDANGSRPGVRPGIGSPGVLGGCGGARSLRHARSRGAGGVEQLRRAGDEPGGGG